MLDSAYGKVSYELVSMLQSKLLDYIKATPLRDQEWVNRFNRLHSGLVNLESNNRFKLSRACEPLARHTKRKIHRKNWSVDKRPYYSKMKAKLLKKYRPIGKRPSILEDKDFWLIDNSIVLESLQK